MNFVMDEIRHECEIAWTESGLTGKPLKDPVCFVIAYRVPGVVGSG